MGGIVLLTCVCLRRGLLDWVLMGRLRGTIVLWAVVSRRVLGSVPVFRNAQVEGGMCLHHSLSSKCLCYRSEHMVLNMARLDVVWVTGDEGHVLAFLIFKTDLPSTEEFRPRLDIG